MNINIYTNYKIQYESTGCLIDEENSTSNYRVFSNFKHKDNFIEEGGALINRIAKYMLDNDCNEIKIENNHVVIMYFNLKIII